MNFTRELRNLTKICSLALACIFLFAGCQEKTLDTHEDTSAGDIENVQFEETENPTNFVKIEMMDGGIILIELYPDIAPITVENFKKLVSKKFYDGLIFHRVIENFVIQAGDPTGTGYHGSDETIKGEFGINGFSNNLSHVPGVISMARSEVYDSASSQFFICHGDCRESLDGRYAGFGKVIAGMDTVDKIAKTSTNGSDRPIKDQQISSIKFVNITK